MDLTGWTLSDARRDPLFLEQSLNEEQRKLPPGQAVQIKPINPLQLSNNGGVIILRKSTVGNSNRGERVDRVKYSREQAGQEGRAITFIDRFR